MGVLGIQRKRWRAIFGDANRFGRAIHHDDRGATIGGSDWSELALAYIHTQSGDGLVILFNAPNLQALAAMPDAIRWLDPDSPLADKYERWYDKARLQESAN